MIRGLLLDCGGVMIAPATGDWVLPPGYAEVLGGSFVQRHLERFRRVRGQFVKLLPDANRVEDEAQECAMFIRYFEVVFQAMDMKIAPGKLERLAWLQTYRADRYTCFDDVLPMLQVWKGRYKLGIVSDAPPSTRRLMAEMGAMQYIDGATFSCEIGALKPDPAIYRATLSKLNVQPGEAVFVDDMPDKLRGAQEVGIRCVQMCRPMPPLFPALPPWDGPVAHDFASLDRVLRAMEVDSSIMEV